MEVQKPVKKNYCSETIIMLGKLGCFIVLQRTKPTVSTRPKLTKQKRKTANLWASRQSRTLVEKMTGPTSQFGI